MRVGAGTVLLAWAKDRDGGKVDVRALDAASRRARAPFSCLGCGEPLVARLGAVRARHFAHRPGSACPLTAPETALHLDAKERLLALCRDAFSGARRARVLARCPSCRRPAPRDLTELGDDAVAEGAVGALRADVLVRSRGAPALALEVRVSHALEAQKEAALAGASIPFVEIDAREEWLREEAGVASVLAARSAGFPPCAACRAAARIDAERARGGEAAEVAELELYRARGLHGAASPAPGGLEEIAGSFRCPECGGRSVEHGGAILRHACPGASARPVAWTALDGQAVALGWWRR